MTARERALRIFQYRDVDKPAFDLMEGTSWDSMGYYFYKEYGLKDTDEIVDFLDCDFRWSHMYRRPRASPTAQAGVKGLSGSNFSDSTGGYRLAGAATVADVDRLFNPDPYAREIPDYRAMREQYPDKALVCCVSWTPFFSGACQEFGMERAMMVMLTEPEFYHAFAIKQKEYLCEYIRRCVKAGAAEYCDFLFQADDFAVQKGLMLSPALWRKMCKPYLAEATRIAKDAGLHTVFHSCGAVSEVYGDFIDMGIDCHIGVQTSAKGMDIERLARDFGGKIVIFGGVDAQTTLTSCTPVQVEEEVRRNMRAFEECGGYIVSNSHHGLPDMPGENLVAMARAAGREPGK